MLNDFISIHDLTPYQFNHLLDLADQIKTRPRRFQDKLKEKTIALLFQKPSLRTRVTFEVGTIQLGGKAIFLGSSEIQMGKRESPYDVCKNLERWVDGVIIRTFEHKIVTDFARNTEIPVINALTDLLHPCEAMSDIFTLQQCCKDLTRLKLAFIGDGNNVCHSLLFAAAKAGIRTTVATPSGFEPDPEIIKLAEEDGRDTGYHLHLTHAPSEAAQDADVVYTDTWISMGQEEAQRRRIFAPFQVNKELMANAKPGAFFMHCLPAYRGQEVTDEVIDSPKSLVYDQAENKLHIQKAIMVLLLADKK